MAIYIPTGGTDWTIVPDTGSFPQIKGPGLVLAFDTELGKVIFRTPDGAWVDASGASLVAPSMSFNTAPNSGLLAVI